MNRELSLRRILEGIFFSYFPVSETFILIVGYESLDFDRYINSFKGYLHSKPVGICPEI